jgi:hypothetical protein
MKRSYPIKKFEKGQVTPLAILMLLLIIIPMIALIVDGAAVMSNRRMAQAAADAGALAGAQRACLGYNDAKTVAENYATAKNNATTALAIVEGKQVTVNATVQYSSFFAGILGDPILEASAEAIAGCYGVRGKGVVPLAWHCWPNDGVGPFNDEYGCEMQTLDWEEIQPLIDGEVSPVAIEDFDGNSKLYRMSGTSIVDDSTGKLTPEQIYIIFDSDKLCVSDIDCDLDNDGKDDLQLGGDRSWLYLTASTTNITEWITGNPSISLDTHIWLTGKSGEVAAAVNKMIDVSWPGQVVLVPVYNEFCLTKPNVTPACVTAAHASPPWPAYGGADDFSEMKNQDPYYHVIAFTPFYISCISKNGNCPGYIYADKVINGNKLKDSEQVIEGYFLSGVEVSLETTDFCSYDLGNCTVSLSK